MRVYHAGDSRLPSITVAICPANDPLAIRGGLCSDWLTRDGKPKTFEVEFRYGEAVVPAELGKYLIDRGIAKRTKLIIPAGMVA